MNDTPFNKVDDGKRNDLRELYQELILDHNRTPHNHHALDHPDRQAEGFNPLCGDRVTVFLTLEGDIVKEASFVGSGCAISTASASMMTDSIRGKTLEQARELFVSFHGMVTGNPVEENGKRPGLGKLEVFSGVCDYPIRVKCASLVWHTLNAAIDNAGEPVTTE